MFACLEFVHVAVYWGMDVVIVQFVLFMALGGRFSEG